MRLILWTVIAYKILCSAALAHDVGCDGKPPSAEIKSSCCGNHDWKRLQAGEWKEDGGTYYVLLDGQWEAVVKDVTEHDARKIQAIQPMPSEDGCNYVWYRRQQGGHGGIWPDDETAHMGSGRLAFYCLQLSMTF